MKAKNLLCTAVSVMAFSQAAFADETEILRFANVTNQPSIDAAQVLVDTAARESHGRLVIKNYPANVLGDDRTVCEAVIFGHLEMVQTQPSVLASFVPDLNIWDAPFIFDRIEDAWACIDGPLGHAINDQVERIGLKYLAAVENGYRHYTNDVRPVRVPSDLRGQKMRVLQTELQEALWRNFGAEPTQMSFSEIDYSLRRHKIDAQENPFSIIDSNKFYEIQHYISLTGHVFSPHNLYVNKEIYDNLAPELRTALDKAAAAYQTAQRARAEELNALSVDKFKAAGCEVIELTDAERQQWKDATQQGKIYDLIKIKLDHPDYLDRILAHDY